MLDFDINYWEKIISLFIGVVQALVIAFFVNDILKRNRKYARTGEKFTQYGVTDVNATGILSRKELAHLFDNATEIKILLMDGYNWLERHDDNFKKAIKRGAKIKMLMAEENSEFIKEVAEMLAIFSTENKTGEELEETINKEIIKCKEIAETKYSGNLQIKQYKGQYRMPIIIGNFKDKDDDTYKQVWSSLVVPVRNTSNAIMVKSHYHENNEDDYQNDKGQLFENSRNLAFDADAYFDYLWKKY